MPNWLSVALLLVLSAPVAGQIAILQLQVIEGEGVVYTTGSRSQRPVTVQVTDETGRPVAGATVSFRLSEDGQSVFRTGLRTEVQVSGPDGRVSVWGIRPGRIPGPIRIRVTAAKDQARAGTLVSQFVAEARTTTSEASSPGGRSRKKWIVAALAAGALSGLAASLADRSGGPPAAAATTAVQVGAPTITIGRP